LEKTKTTVRKKAAATASIPDEGTEQHPLADLIPDKLYGDEYVSRDLNGVRDIDVLRYAKEARKNVILSGPTGPGKTSLILAYAAIDRLPLVTINCNGAIEPGQAFGQPVMTEDGKIVFQESPAVEVIRNGGVLYLDEVNFMPPKIAAVFHGLLDKRREIVLLDKGGEVIRAHPDFQVVAAYNPDYEGTRRLNPAFKNRYAIKLRFDYDRGVESQLVYLPVMLDVADRLRASHKAGDLETPVSTNMLIEFEELAWDLGYDFAVENFLSAFGDDERSAVREVLELFSAQIRTQLAELEASQATK
jgi:nitric oxide reductase NorQ protein